MARFIQDVVLNKPDDFVYFMMNDYLQKNGFVTSDWKGEPAYRAGDGFMEGYKYLKWSYTSGVFHLEAWMKGTFGGEMNLDGFVGCLMKKPYKENLMRLITLLQQTIPESGQTMGAAQTAGTGGGRQQVLPAQPETVPQEHQTRVLFRYRPWTIIRMHRWHWYSVFFHWYYAGHLSSVF